MRGAGLKELRTRPSSSPLSLPALLMTSEMGSLPASSRAFWRADESTRITGLSMGPRTATGMVREATGDELKRLLGHANWPIVDVSATTGQGLSDLRDAIRVAASGSSLRDPTDLFRMPIDRSFSVRGAGTVVTGTTWSGTVRVGETLGVHPGDRPDLDRDIRHAGGL